MWRFKYFSLVALLESLVLGKVAEAVGRKAIPTLLLPLRPCCLIPSLWEAPKSWTEGCDEGLSVYGCIRLGVWL